MFEKIAQEMMEKANYVQALGGIYDVLTNRMNWDCMKYHNADDAHKEAWFTDFEEDEMTDYVRAQAKAYKAVLEAIEKLAK